MTDRQSAQISQKQDGRNVYVIIKQFALLFITTTADCGDKREGTLFLCPHTCYTLSVLYAIS